MTESKPLPLRIGVVMTDSVQLLDLAAVDLFFMATPEYLEVCGLPKPVTTLGKPCEIYYIGKHNSGSYQDCTSQLSVRITHTIADQAVAPGNLDLLYIPGPDPNAVPPKEVSEFIQTHNSHGTTIISICTGIYVCGYSGVLKGKNVTGPRALVPALKKKFPDAARWDDSIRFVHDGNLWTSGQFGSIR